MDISKAVQETWPEDGDFYAETTGALVEWNKGDEAVKIQFMYGEGDYQRKLTVAVMNNDPKFGELMEFITDIFNRQTEGK